MRVYHSLVFDDFVVGTTAVYTDPKWNMQLASADKIKIALVADQATGTTPTVLVQIEESGDNRNFMNKNGSAEIPATTITTSGSFLAFGNDPGTTPMSGYARLRIVLGGTSPQAHLKIYVTGRGEVPPT